MLKLALMLRHGLLGDAPAVLNRITQNTRRSTSADSWSQGLFRVEVLSTLSRETSQWDIAEQLADLMLTVDPYYGGSHYAKALVADHRGDRTAAVQEFEAAKKYWNHADFDFPPLSVMKRASSKAGAVAPRPEYGTPAASSFKSAPSKKSLNTRISIRNRGVV
jgi:hypothetical protein